MYTQRLGLGEGFAKRLENGTLVTTITAHNEQEWKRRIVIGAPLARAHVVGIGSA